MPKSTIYHPSIPPPPLPEQSIFHYLFPELDNRRHIPEEALTFVDALTGRSVTRRDVLSQARRLAHGMRNRAGLKRGDVVGVVGMNSLEWLNAVYGSLCAGLRVSPINYAYTPPELLHQLHHSSVSLIFIGPTLIDTLHRTLELGRVNGFTLPPDRVILLCTKDAKPKHSPYRCIEELWDKEELEPERFESGDEHETAFLCYSSGTTGVAKGVETTHYNMTSQLQSLSVTYEPLKRGSDVVLGYLPFSHMYSLTLLVMQILTVGVPLVILPRFDEKDFLRAVEKYKITWALCVPPVLIVLRNSTLLERYRLETLRGMMSAAAPLSEDLCKAVEKRLPGCRITQAYGLTETSPLTHHLSLSEAAGRQSSIGKLLPTYQARLVDSETGQDVPSGTGQPGELWVRGPSVMKGYYKNPAATSNTFAPAEDGDAGGRWFKTGDSAYVDKEGYYFIADRLKELIKYKGYQAELEAVLLTHPQIADVAVIGIWIEDQATELPRAYVVPKGGLSAMTSRHARESFCKEVEEWMKDKVAQHKRIRGGCVLIEAVPKSPSGKILRKNLRVMVDKEKQAAAKAKL